jgi:hypothetical protein
MAWQHRKYGTATDPIHKSHLKELSGAHSCPKRFWFKCNAEVTPERDTVSGKMVAGTAAHETIARALSNRDFCARLLRGDEPITRTVVKTVYYDEYEREVGGRRVQWYKHDETDVLEDCVDMVLGLLNRLHEHVAEVVLVEPGFVAKCGEYWLSGHIDLLYRPRSAPGRLAICDWKTGASKPHEIELDHSWEGSVYSAAVYGGYFLPRDAVAVEVGTDGLAVATIGKHRAVDVSRSRAERQALELALIDIALRIDTGAEVGWPYEQHLYVAHEFPAHVHYVHLPDYVPYSKAGTKAINRREDLDFFGYAAPVKSHKYIAGQQRGPAWLPVALTEHDLPRLAARLRNVVGMVRMGRFIEQIGEQCSRCAYRPSCLTSGYGPTGEARDDLNRTLRAIPGAAADGDDLGTD